MHAAQSNTCLHLSPDDGIASHVCKQVVQCATRTQGGCTAQRGTSPNTAPPRSDHSSTAQRIPADRSSRRQPLLAQHSPAQHMNPLAWDQHRASNSQSYPGRYYRTRRGVNGSPLQSLPGRLSEGCPAASVAGEGHGRQHPGPDESCPQCVRCHAGFLAGRSHTPEAALHFLCCHRTTIPAHDSRRGSAHVGCASSKLICTLSWMYCALDARCSVWLHYSIFGFVVH